MAYVPMNHMTNGELFEDAHVNQLIDNIEANHEAIVGIEIPTDYAKEASLEEATDSIKQEMDEKLGNYVVATDVEYASFESHVQELISQILEPLEE